MYSKLQHTSSLDNFIARYAVPVIIGADKFFLADKHHHAAASVIFFARCEKNNNFFFKCFHVS